MNSLTLIVGCSLNALSVGKLRWQAVHGPHQASHATLKQERA
jgi:hypothetical protein